jgi:opacity protein-like surface antigen
MFVTALLGCAAAARAQTASGAASAPVRGYVAGVAEAAFGNQTSQSYGAEAGVAVSKVLQVFVEGGEVRTAAPAAQGTNAQLIATGLGATFTAKQPVGFGVAGVRYLVPVSGSKVQPYLSIGAGAARVTQDVHFFVAGADVTSNVTQLGAVLGSDLSGSVTKAMVAIGGGVVWPVWQHVFVDLHYRYGRVFVPDQGLNLNRAGLSIGYRF